MITYLYCDRRAVKKVEVRWTQGSPTWHQDGPKIAQGGSKIAPKMAPRWSHDGPKVAHPQNLP